MKFSVYKTVSFFILVSISALISVSSFASNTGVVEPSEIKEVNLPKITIKLDLESSDSESKFGSTGDWFSIFALLISLASSGFSIYQYRSNKHSSIKETFWMREVLMPQFLEVFLAFIKNAPLRYDSVNNLGTFYTNYALSELNTLTDTTNLLAIGTSGLKSKIIGYIDDFENHVMNVTSRDELVALLDVFAENVVKEIQGSQIKL